MAYVCSSNDVSRYVWIGIITKLVRRMVMSVLFRLYDNTIVEMFFLIKNLNVISHKQNGIG